ncbi:TIGR04063 family PEP-CTERM/XrtA system glycosyltransferase [Desulfospira joergensenii]|uniref:TIGR04063 family PEP-CTERM/XrtA system glycosyltransferase n=1 Tax=Desulfospira joergensenii TaxID=53329 RepID=UPI0003B723EC|nr:TIGR04063 family PEP-CTERM/XrtA system glycosyltransferase [Desulfospira joergensenii]
MKILHILDHSLPLHSGYTFRSQNILLAQKKMGFQPIVLTSPKHEESLKKETALKEVINGFSYYRTGVISTVRLPFFTEFKLMHRLYKRILEVAGVEKPDLIHAHSPVLNGIPAIRAARKLNIPVVYEIRAFWEDAAVDHGTYKEDSWKYRLTKFIETWVCKKVDHIFILCNGLKNDLVKRGLSNEKITIVFNGINPDDFKSPLSDDLYLDEWSVQSKRVIGFIGSFYRYEGLDLLIKAFARISVQYENSVLLLVGGGEMKQELTRLVKERNLQDKVIMPGRIPHERVPGVYAMIDILVYPRYSMRLTELVTPLKPLEAMAMGKALVASDVGGHYELINDRKTGLLFKAGNEDSLVDSISELLNDIRLMDALQNNGEKWVTEHHTWKNTTSVYKSEYKWVLENNTG